MPQAYVKKMAKEHGLSISTAERKWDKAKMAADKEGHGEDYAYVTAIFKKMVGESEELVEGKVKELTVDVGELLDKDIKRYNKAGGAEVLAAAVKRTSANIAKKHRLDLKDVTKFVNDYVDSAVKESVNESIGPHRNYKIHVMYSFKNMEGEYIVSAPEGVDKAGMIEYLNKKPSFKGVKLVKFEPYDGPIGRSKEDAYRSPRSGEDVGSLREGLTFKQYLVETAEVDIWSADSGDYDKDHPETFHTIGNYPTKQEAEAALAKCPNKRIMGPIHKRRGPAAWLKQGPK